MSEELLVESASETVFVENGTIVVEVEDTPTQVITIDQEQIQSVVIEENVAPVIEMASEGLRGPSGPQGPAGPAGPSGVPVGTPMPWLLTTAPSGFLIADGGTFDGTVYPALAALYGSTFGAVSGNLYRLPNLKGRFLVGQDTADTGTVNVDRISQIRDIGGSKAVTLTAAQSGVPAHSHPATGSTAGETQEHQHYVSVGGGGHEHVYGGRRSNRIVTGGGAATVTDSGEGTWATTGGGGHTHEAWSGGRSATHTHATTVTVSNNTAANASQSHLNMPPYYTCLWIIRATP